MSKTIFHRASSGDERLWKVFWLLWIPFIVFIVFARRTLIEFISRDAMRSSSWLFYLPSLLFGICTVWLLIALWKCSSNVKFPVFFWLSRLYVVIRFISLIHAAGALLRAT
jgi:hypothetical protein